MNTATQQPDPLELAGWLDFWSQPTAKKAAAALRRLHAENEQLRARVLNLEDMLVNVPVGSYQKLRARVHRLEEMLESVGAGGVGPLIPASVQHQRNPNNDNELQSENGHLGTSSSSSVPAGWKLVPVETSIAMIAAGARESVRRDGEPYCIYQAMLAAAPNPPAVKESLTDEQPPVVDQPESAYLLRDLADDISVDALELIAAIRDAGLGDYSINMRLPAKVCVAMCKRFSDVEHRPVARVTGTGHLGGHFDWCVPGNQGVPRGTLLYTRPQPQRELLTPEQIMDAWREAEGTRHGFFPFARAIERRAHGIGGAT